MTSLKRHEGWMFIDNRNSPGVEDEALVKLGYPVGAGHGLFESATYTCSHCNSVVVIEPKRTRERGFCRGCGQRLCDACSIIKERTLTCRSMEQRISEMQELDAAGQTAPVPPLILLDKEIRNG